VLIEAFLKMLRVGFRFGLLAVPVVHGCGRLSYQVRPDAGRLLARLGVDLAGLGPATVHGTVLRGGGAIAAVLVRRTDTECLPAPGKQDCEGE
ncbi:hypothetical protein LAN17_22315, partial [Mycobacterium tuberculosis]|nr:hypothetical protein [Mycobacterium tuberculosis]